jgi:hypothetical protein
MAKKIGNYAFALLIFLFSSQLLAQEANVNTSVSISGGQFFQNPISGSVSNSLLSSSTTKQTSKFTPHIALKIEQRLFKYFSIGLSLHSFSAISERTIENNGFLNFTSSGLPQTQPQPPTLQKVKSGFGGVSFNVKGFFYANPQYDVYAGASVGVLQNNEDIKTLNPSAALGIPAFQSLTETTGLLDINIGMRYFMANNLGIYGEIGSSKIHIISGITGQVGAIYRF